MTCGLAMLEKGRLSGDWCSLIYHQFSTELRARRAKATFCLKIRSAFVKLYFDILWPKELEGLD